MARKFAACPIRKLDADAHMFPSPEVQCSTRTLLKTKHFFQKVRPRRFFRGAPLLPTNRIFSKPFFWVPSVNPHPPSSSPRKKGEKKERGAKRGERRKNGFGEGINGFPKGQFYLASTIMMILSPVGGGRFSHKKIRRIFRVPLVLLVFQQQTLEFLTVFTCGDRELPLFGSPQ